MNPDRDGGMLSEAVVDKIARPVLVAAERAEMGIAVSMVDGTKLHRVYVSEVAARIFGYTVEELLALPTLRTFPPEEAARMLDISLRWQRGEPVPYFLETAITTKDGARRPVEVGFSYVEIDGKRATVSFFRDITLRKRTEEALKKSESLFRQLIEAAPEAVVVTREALPVYANPGFLRLLGYERIEDVTGIHVLEFIHPEDRGWIDEQRRFILSSPATAMSESIECRAFRKDGSVVSVEAVALAIEFEGAPAVLTFLRDVTQRREAQALLILKDRMAAIGTLAAGVAHELNNPLAYVLLNMDLLERDLGELVITPASRGRISERLRVLREGASHMASVVRDLRSFCRQDSPPQRIDVRKVLESAIEMTMHQVKDRVQLVREYTVVESVWADGARLGQVFLNLLMNAVQAAREDGARQHEIRVVLRPQGPEQVRVEFTDTGCGIPAHLLDRIFDPFFTTKPPGVGTGLGLSISRSILQTMNGQLTVESQLGRGSTFCVLLPTATGA